MKRLLDLEVLEDIVYSGILIGLEADIRNRLEALPAMKEFHERAQAALMFFLQTHSGDEIWRHEARVRAGLNEFYSLEDAARRGFKATVRGTKAPKLSESEHPLVHLMYSLRHINVHVKPSSAEVRNITVRFNDPEHDREYTYGAVMLTDGTMDDLLNHADVKKHYRSSEMTATTNWVLRNQQAFGVGRVFEIGVEAYCREVLAPLN